MTSVSLVRICEFCELPTALRGILEAPCEDPHGLVAGPNLQLLHRLCVGVGQLGVELGEGSVRANEGGEPQGSVPHLMPGALPNMRRNEPPLAARAPQLALAPTKGTR